MKTATLLFLFAFISTALNAQNNLQKKEIKKFDLNKYLHKDTSQFFSNSPKFNTNTTYQFLQLPQENNLFAFPQKNAAKNSSQQFFSQNIDNMPIANPKRNYWNMPVAVPDSTLNYAIKQKRFSRSLIIK